MFKPNLCGMYFCGLFILWDGDIPCQVNFRGTECVLNTIVQNVLTNKVTTVVFIQNYMESIFSGLKFTYLYHHIIFELILCKNCNCYVMHDFKLFLNGEIMQAHKLLQKNRKAQLISR